MDPTPITNPSWLCSSCSGSREAACNSQNTKRLDITFHAVLGDGTREVRFERLLARHRLEIAHVAVEAAAVEARRRVRLNESR